MKSRLISNIRYRLGLQLSWTGLALIIYVFTLFLTFYLLIATGVVNSGEGSLVYRMWGLIFFLIAISMRFKEDFEFLQMMSNSREMIYRSFLTTGAILSMLFSTLIVIERFIVDHLNEMLGFRNIVDPFHFISPYMTDSTMQQWLFFFTLFLAFSVFAIMMGSLFYRFGKLFTLVFWLVLSALPTIFLPMFLWMVSQQGDLSEYMQAIAAYFRYFDLSLASGVLFIIVLFFGIAGCINIRRLPLR